MATSPPTARAGSGRQGRGPMPPPSIGSSSRRPGGALRSRADYSIDGFRSFGARPPRRCCDRAAVRVCSVPRPIQSPWSTSRQSGERRSTASPRHEAGERRTRRVEERGPSASTSTSPSAGRCDYCAFVTYTGATTCRAATWGGPRRARAATGRSEIPAATSVFFGGGTPSRLGPELLGPDPRGHRRRPAAR